MSPDEAKEFVKFMKAKHFPKLKAHTYDCTDTGEPCEAEGCQECCPHGERDHGICMVCEHEEDPGMAIDRAMDAIEDR